MTLLILNGISSGVYAMELGGFDVSAGADEIDDWADWDNDETGGASEEWNDGGGSGESDDTYENSISAGGRTSTAQETESWQEIPFGSENTGNAGSDITAEQSDLQSSNPEVPMDTGNPASGSYDGSGQRYTENMERKNDVETVWELTDTPLPTPSPTITPTATPTPVLTEVPESEVSKVTEFHEEYRIPPAECLKKMKLFYWNKTVRGGKRLEIEVSHRVVAVVSFRINDQEESWAMDSGRICTGGLDETVEYNVELVMMVPTDLTWTETQKNVILSCNVF